MKNILAIILFFLAFACSRKETASEDFNYSQWINENTLPKHKALLKQKIEDYKSPNDEYEFLSKPVIKTTKQVGDTLVVSIAAEMVLSCSLLSNIEIKEDSIFLLFGDICNPKQTDFVTENGNVLFTYWIYNPEKKKYKIVPDSKKSLRIKKS
jgi:hypothetical protein